MLQLYETISKQKYFKKTLFRKNNFGGITTLNLKKKLQSLSNKNSIILEQKLTYRPNGTKSKSQT